MSTRIYIPDNKSLKVALKRVKTWAIVAHQDDAEIIGGEAISYAFLKKRREFGVIVLTDGAGSIRSDKTKKMSPEKIIELRNREQEKAAKSGNYSIVIQMNLPSAVVKGKRSRIVAIGELLQYLSESRAHTILTHTPFDRHETHRAVSSLAQTLFGRLDSRIRPLNMIGIEVWGSLDWLPEDEKLFLPISNPKLIVKLLASYPSQNETGKNFHLATEARMRVNATFSEEDGGHFLIGHDLIPFVTGDYAGIILKKFSREVKKY